MLNRKLLPGVPVILELKEIAKKYGTRTVLQSISFSIYEGEIISLLGVNGAGKTTLFSLIASLRPPTSGSLLFKNKSIYDDILAYRNALGFCPQKPNFEKALSVEENLIFAGLYFGLSHAIVKERVQQMLHRFGLTRFRTQSPDVLSGGYKQRLLIARALMHNPKLLVLDEPTVAMDQHIRRQLWDHIKALKKDGVTIILTTHYLDEAEYLSDRICILDKGRIRFFDTVENLKQAHGLPTLEKIFIKLVAEDTSEEIRL